MDLMELSCCSLPRSANNGHYCCVTIHGRWSAGSVPTAVDGELQLWLTAVIKSNFSRYLLLVFDAKSNKVRWSRAQIKSVSHARTPMDFSEISDKTMKLICFVIQTFTIYFDSIYSSISCIGSLVLYRWVSWFMLEQEIGTVGHKIAIKNTWITRNTQAERDVTYLIYNILWKAHRLNIRSFPRTDLESSISTDTNLLLNLLELIQNNKTYSEIANEPCCTKFGTAIASLWQCKNTYFWNSWNEKSTNYTEQNYKCNTFVFAPIFHELNSFLCTQKVYFPQILFTNLSKSVLVGTSPLPR